MRDASLVPRCVGVGWLGLMKRGQIILGASRCMQTQRGTHVPMFCAIFGEPSSARSFHFGGYMVQQTLFLTSLNSCFTITQTLKSTLSGDKLNWSHVGSCERRGTAVGGTRRSSSGASLRSTTSSRPEPSAPADTSTEWSVSDAANRGG